MKNLKYVALPALVLIASIGLLQAAPTPIMAPKIIMVPGSYILANDIAGTSGIAVIEIQASDVTLNLNGHTITATGAGVTIDEFVGNNTGNATLVNAHVSNGQIVAGAQGVLISGSSCLVDGLKITVSQSATPIVIEHGNSNRVHSCVLSAATGQTASAAISLFLTSHNTIQNNTLTGIYLGISKVPEGSGFFRGVAELGVVTVLGATFHEVNPVARGRLKLMDARQAPAQLA
jgi:hypothetical protein